MLGPYPNQRCEWCQQPYRPRVYGQRYCDAECRRLAKAFDGRKARAFWVGAGRPDPFRCEEVEQ
jgi:hypothetical protein